MKKSLKVSIIIAVITCIISISGSYAATNYAISANNISYSDNSNLGAVNVQAAVDGTCVKFNNQLTSLKGDIIDTIYPIGSIYISESDATSTAVQNRFKTFGKDTTWEVYGSGKVLVGSGTGTDANGNSQTFSVSSNSKNLGEYNHTLSIDEMPSHTHIQDPHYHYVGFDNNNIKRIGSGPGDVDSSTSAYLTNYVIGARTYTQRFTCIKE